MALLGRGTIHTRLLYFFLYVLLMPLWFMVTAQPFLPQPDTNQDSRRAQEGPPDQVYNGDQQRPILEGGQVGQIIGGVSDKAEERTTPGCPKGVFIVNTRLDDKISQGGGVKQIKDDCRQPVGCIGHQEANLRLVEARGDQSEPERVKDEEDQQSKEIVPDSYFISFPSDSCWTFLFPAFW